MNYLYKRRRSGQSLPLFALMMVFIIAMVGVSVDVSNTYAEERRMQNGANAAALAGMNTIVTANPGTKASNDQVWKSIQLSAASNRVNNTAKDYVYYADYLVDNGGGKPARVRLGDWNGYTSKVTPGLAPDNVIRIQVTMEHRVPAYFTPIVGWKNFNVNVEGSVCLGGYGLGVLPMGIPQTLYPTNGTAQYHVITQANGATLSPTDAKWGNWNEMRGMTIKFPAQNGVNSIANTLIPWLSWKSTNTTTDLKAAMNYPGSLHDGFTEATPNDTRLPNTSPFNRLTLGDWVKGNTTYRSDMASSLTKLQQDGTEVALPIYDRSGSDAQTSFHIVRMGRFKLVSFSLNGTTSSNIQLQYLGDQTYAVAECAPPLPDVPQPPSYPIEGRVQYTQIYGKAPTKNVLTTYDIVIVMDLSGSMNQDWYDRPATGANARMADARKAIVNIVQDFDVESDPDARMALITFNNDSAKKQVGLEKNGCPKPTIEEPNRKCKKTEKWTSIQNSAATLTPIGGTPGPLAFEMARDMLRDNVRTPPAGKRYGQVVIFATDGVFNVCGGYTENRPDINLCPSGSVVPPFPNNLLDGTPYTSYTNNAAYNVMPGRPIWQAQKVAAQIKATGARIFTVALKAQCLPTIPSCFNPAGLSEMSSGSGFAYQANDSSSMAKIYDTIMEKITETGAGCDPYSKPLAAAPGAKVLLTQAQNPTFKEETTTDPNGNFRFSNLRAGVYTLTVKPAYQAKGDDGVTRTYSTVVNSRNPNETDKATVDINDKRPDGAATDTGLELYIEKDANGVPLSPCPLPTK